MKKISLFLGICLLIASVSLGQIDYAKKAEAFEAHVDAEDNFSLSYEELVGMQDTLDTLSIRMIKLLMSLEEEKDSLQIDSLDQELVTLRKKFFNIISLKILEIPYEEVENFSLRPAASLSSEQLKLGILFKIHFPIEEKGYHRMAVNNNPKLELFF